MSTKINHVAVIGAGTMGAAIAAHIANAGVPVLLLDIVPAQLSLEEEARGLTLDNPNVRNRIVQAGFDRLQKTKPAPFMGNAAAQRITLGNTKDDFNKLAGVDWIIEAIIEKIHPKQALLARIDAVRKPSAIVTTNTSGLPLALLAEGRSDGFKQHFLGTHFFNPPRYMKLLEIIPTPTTDPTVRQTMTTFAEERLGKGIVICKDTPNFIGNRLFLLSNCFAINYALEQGYTVEEVDALTGPLLGRPKTATFRLMDLVGIDVAAYIAQNLYPLIPNDPYREALRTPRLVNLLAKLVERGWLGNKSKQGFYKQDKDAQGNRVFKILNPETFAYEMPQKPRFEAVEAIRKTNDVGRRLSALFSEHRRDDRAAQYVWAVISYELAYAAACAPEIAHNLKSIDDDIRWGFGFQLGPFQLWDELGVAETVARIEKDQLPVAPWVKEMLQAGYNSFYQMKDGQPVGYYNWKSRQYEPIRENPRHIKIEALRHSKKVLHQNTGASILDMGDGVLLVEFHAKMNTIDEDIIKMMAQARTLLEENDDYIGLVVGNEGENFCAGANIFVLAMAAQQGEFDQLETLLTSLQETLLAFRYSAKPVVVAVHNRALGGGAEVVLGSSRVVAHAESYIGLVEPGVGLVPAAGGVTALVRCILSSAMRVPHTDPLPLAQKILETIGTAAVGPSAAESRTLGFLTTPDRIVMNRDCLLYEAKQEVLAMAANHYTPPAKAQLYAGGRDLFAALKTGVWLWQQSGYISKHDALVGEKLAYIIAGGNLSAPQWVDERHFLKLELKAFVELAGTEKTQARIWYMLDKGKPLRN